MQIGVSTGELVLLQKLIDHVKFGAVDEGSTRMAGNPFINSLSDKVSGELKKLGVGDKHASKDYLRDHREIAEVVVKKLDNLSDLEGMEMEDRKELALNMVYPYLAAESELEEIVEMVAAKVSDEELEIKNWKSVTNWP